MNKSLFSNKYLLLGFILLLHIAGWLFLKPVWPFSDDYCYSLNAHNFLTQPLHLTYNQFQNRFGVYLPVSFFFKCFGINPYVISLWPLLASIFSISVVFFFIDKFVNIKVAFISAFLIATNVLQITYSIALFPDLIVSFYTVSIILLLYYAREYGQTRIVYPILINILLIIGFLTKETILLILPFLLVTLCFDIYQKRNNLFWKRTILFGLCSLLLLMFMYYLITGDAFHRIRSMIDFADNKMMRKEDEQVVKAIWSSNIFVWLNKELGYIFLLLFSIPAFLSLRKEKIGSFKSYITIFSLLMLIEFIVLFHTEKYGVVFMQDRLWMLLIAPLSIVSAYFIFQAENKFYIILIALFVVLSIVNYYTVGSKRALLFGLFLVFIICAYYLKRKNKNYTFLLLLPFLLLFINFVYANSNYRVPALRASNVIKNEIEKLNTLPQKTIFCAEDFADNHIIYNGFIEYQHLQFLPFNKYDSVKVLPNTYILVNTAETGIPDFITKNPNQWKVVVDDQKLLIYTKK